MRDYIRLLVSFIFILAIMFMIVFEGLEYSGVPGRLAQAVMEANVFAGYFVCVSGLFCTFWVSTHIDRCVNAIWKAAYWLAGRMI